MQSDRPHRRTRREVLKGLAIGGLSLPLAGMWPAFAKKDEQHPQPTPAPTSTTLSQADQDFLYELECLTFRYFWEQASPATGLVKDRCNLRVSQDNGIVASTAATGFGLTALCIADQEGFVLRDQAIERVTTTLRALWKKLPNHRGFFYHWANINTGERIWDSEISSVDTAILLCGVLACREHFNVKEISQLANDIFSRVDWTWLSEDTTLLAHGWTPEFGFLPVRWDYYSELMMMYLLGLGSDAHPLRPDAWNAWKRLIFEYDGQRYIGSFAPLFIHQYSQAWFDFRGKRDHYTDYFQNSIFATDAHRKFCLELASQFPSYDEDLWGITASDSERGYVIWGGPPAMGPIDGSVVPSAAAGSLPFMPEATMRVLRNIRTKYERAWSRYGFVNAFNPSKNWYDTDAVGIDTGITMLMAENLRTGFVWKTFMKTREATRGMERAGFAAYT